MKRLANVGEAYPSAATVTDDGKARPALTPSRAEKTIEAQAAALVAADANNWNLDLANKHLHERMSSAEKANASFNAAFDEIYDAVGGVPDKVPLTLDDTLASVVGKVKSLATMRRAGRRSRKGA